MNTIVHLCSLEPIWKVPVQKRGRVPCVHGQQWTRPFNFVSWKRSEGSWAKRRVGCPVRMINDVCIINDVCMINDKRVIISLQAGRYLESASQEGGGVPPLLGCWIQLVVLAWEVGNSALLARVDSSIRASLATSASTLQVCALRSHQQ